MRNSTRFFIPLLALLAAAASLSAPVARGALEGEWLAGDLHVHTVWGFDTCITPTERWDFKKNDFDARKPCEESHRWAFTPRQQLTNAELRGLDYLAITDHNNVMAFRHPEMLSYGGPLVVLGGYENTFMNRGHYQMLGARECFTNFGPVSYPWVECHRLVGDLSETGVRSMADALRASGGVFQVNHPSDGAFSASFGRRIVPDAIEVFNHAPWAVQSPLIEIDNDFALEYWDRFLRDGKRVAATGGSDNHGYAGHAFRGVGQPTTWVWATERTEAGVLEGIRAGRTFVSAEPPAHGGVRLHLEADAEGDGVFESMVGDAVPEGATFRVRTENAPLGSKLRIVHDFTQMEVPLTGFVYEFTVPEARNFVRVELLAQDAQAERLAYCEPVADRLQGATQGDFQTSYCRNRLSVLALTSPIYLL